MPEGRPGLMRLYTPVIRGITGLVRSEIIVDRAETEHSLADREHIAYPVANPGDPGLTLTVRDSVLGPRHTVPRGEWRLVNGHPHRYARGLSAGPHLRTGVQGAGPRGGGAGTRRRSRPDVLSQVRRASATNFMGDRRHQRAYGFGVSQSGRFLRTFLYYGFNRDEKGRKVFDGMLAHVAGGGLGSFNHRFAQPSRDGHPFFNTLYPTDIFPFTDLAETDPETGLTDGILSHATPPEATPEDLLHQFVVRVLRARGVPHPHHARTAGRTPNSRPAPASISLPAGSTGRRRSRPRAATRRT